MPWVTIRPRPCRDPRSRIDWPLFVDRRNESWTLSRWRTAVDGVPKESPAADEVSWPERSTTLFTFRCRWPESLPNRVIDRDTSILPADPVRQLSQGSGYPGVVYPVLLAPSPADLTAGTGISPGAASLSGNDPPSLNEPGRHGYRRASATARAGLMTIKGVHPLARTLEPVNCTPFRSAANG